MTAIPKPRPRALEKADREKKRAKLDRAENAKVKRRSGGRCEAIDLRLVHVNCSDIQDYCRCHRRAAEIHHLKGGIGKRNCSDSILAKYKLHSCISCHQDITNHVLVPVDPQADAARVVYERRR